MSFTKDATLYALENTAKLWNRRQGLRVDWYDVWHPDLTAALADLPPMGDYSHGLFTALAENQQHAHSRFALVSEHDAPVAVVGLREHGFHWELITQWILPGALFPVQPGHELVALAALGLDVDVAWWRMGTLPPAHPWRRDMTVTPTFGAELTGDFEQHWRATGLFKSVRKARNACSDFTFSVNAPGAAAWTIRQWADKWMDDSAVTRQEVSDRILVADHLTAQGRHFALQLHDGAVPVAGATLFAHGDVAVAGVIYRDPAYDWHGVGTRIIDLCFEWARDAGFSFIDMGGGHAYKEKWGPPWSERRQFHICPPHLYAAKHAFQTVRTHIRQGG